MLRLILGKAGAGKTAAIYREIAAAVAAEQGGRLLIVPEQYSHEAERELCRVCGDSLSLYAEVFSFTGLARRLQAEQGGGAEKLLDKGGRLLCMALALDGVGARLKVYQAARYKPELQDMLLRSLDELKSACVGPEQLMAAAEACPDALGQKLADLSLIAAAYDAVVAQGRADPADRLTVLARQIADSAMGPETHVYVDGFIDFTGQELEVLFALLRRGVELTVCLTVDDPEGDDEVFALSRTSCRRLMAEAERLGLELRTLFPAAGGEKDDALRYLAENLFRYTAEAWAGEKAPLRLRKAESVTAECEAAAAAVLALVRRGGCRWRDIAIAVRGFEDYRSSLESVFRHYGIPLFVTRRSELLSKPLPALIGLAYEILGGGWETDDMISYLHTGLTGLSLDECDALSNYIFRWQLRGAAWERAEDWRQHPEGYGGTYDQAAEDKLRLVNALRRRVAAPLLRFRDRSAAAMTARGQAAALTELLRELKLPQQLESRAAELEARGRAELAGEYSQLWELIVSALEQSAAILGDMELDAQGFGRLFSLMLSKYDVGLIPVALDRVSAGDFDRMRRRRLRHLLVLGCADGRLPMARESAGMFSEEERERLLALEIDLGGGQNELWREFSLIYNVMTLPAESLQLSFSLAGEEGESQRPSFVMNRAAALFDLPIEPVDLNEARLSARDPALSLAAHSFREGGGMAAAAADYFRRTAPERLARLEAAAEMSRGRLSPAAVEALYGRHLRFSASRIDKFAACRFAYFCQYGLKAKPYEPAGFTPPEIGTFLHYVLEHVAGAVMEQGGFAAVDDERLQALTDRFVAEYVHEELNDMREKSSRFKHLFQRLCGDARLIVGDMAAELRRSDFQPLDFELDFSKASDIHPLELGEGEGSLTLTGVADRVDGWVHGDALYLRVVDYKTGTKKFSLSDIWYGMGLQMLLYLFALENDGAGRYGKEIRSAGVMYVPARSAILSLQEELDEEEAERKRAAALRRSGLVLADKDLIEAWEKGEDKRFIPVKFKSRGDAAGSVADAAQMGQLQKHIQKTLTDMARQLRRGNIAADPWYRGQQENACLHCDYYDACHFADGENDEHYRYLPGLKDEEVWDRMKGETEDA